MRLAGGQPGAEHDAALPGAGPAAAARRREAEAAKAELARKIASTRRRSNEVPERPPASLPRLEPAALQPAPLQTPPPLPPPRQRSPTLFDLQPLPEGNEEEPPPAGERPASAAEPRVASAAGGATEVSPRARAEAKVRHERPRLPGWLRCCRRGAMFRGCPADALLTPRVMQHASSVERCMFFQGAQHVSLLRLRPQDRGNAAGFTRKSSPSRHRMQPRVRKAQSV